MTSNRSQKSSSILLIFLLILITFPFWIGLFGIVLGGVAGIMGGIFGAVFGAIGGVIGAVMGIITLPFKLLFGHGHWFPHVNGYVIVILILLVALVVRKRSNSKEPTK